MRRTAAAAATALAMVVAGGAAPASADPAEGTVAAMGGPTAIAGSYVVVLRDSAVAADAVARRAGALTERQGGTVVRTYRHALRGFEARLTERAARRLAADPAVASVTQNHVVTAADVQSPTPSWGLDRIDQRALPGDDSYTYPDGSPLVTAYIVDGGINPSHADFAGRIRSGHDFIDNDEDATDCRGHGTHVAGTLGGTTFGVAKNVELVPVRVLDCEGTGSAATVLAGIDWITADHVAGAPAVANMSLNGRRYAPQEEAVRRSIADGVTYVVSAGNDSGADACANTPAAVPEAITVGATGPDDARAAFSNIGTCVDLFAPGVDITSAFIGGDTATRVSSGTSMAAPHVTGAAALILAAHPDWTPARVTAALLGDATTGVVTDPGAGSPDRLLHVGADLPADDFSLAVTPAAATVTAGGRVSATVATTVTRGAARPVTLSASGLPGNATATFEPSTVDAGGSTPMTVTTGARTAPGTYRVLVTGGGPEATRLAAFTLTVTAPAGCLGANDTDSAVIESTVVAIPVTISGCAAAGAADSTIELHVDHTHVGDLTVDLIAPSGRAYPLLSRTGGSTHDIDYTFTHDLSAEPADGVWRLSLLDNGPGGTGSFDSVVLDLGGAQLPAPACGGIAPTDVRIPDHTGVESPLTVTGCDRAPGAGSYVEVRIVHPWERDLAVYLIAPDGERITLQSPRSVSKRDIFRTYIAQVSGKPANGVWTLRVEDQAWGNPEGGYIDSWKLTL
ncbi:S8 family peptidase [Pseudosporangium ferrugineum]|nr:S8 family peptidase [Pseudosporangium ferrugineum]